MLGKNHELFARAERAYDRAIELIRSLDESFPIHAEKNGGNHAYGRKNGIASAEVIWNRQGA